MRRKLAVSLIAGRLERDLLAAYPNAARTGNPEEDRLLADLAGRGGTERIELLLDAGADLTARGLDSGTAFKLRSQFAESYAKYCDHVPRWIPKLRVPRAV